MRKILAFTLFLVALGFASPPVEAVSYIYKGGCGWEATGQSYAAAWCPHRVTWSGGPQYFRIRMECFSPFVAGNTVIYGSWRTGGNWIASSRSCQSPYSFRKRGGTWIEFLG